MAPVAGLSQVGGIAVPSKSISRRRGSRSRAAECRNFAHRDAPLRCFFVAMRDNRPHDGVDTRSISECRREDSWNGHLGILRRGHSRSRRHSPILISFSLGLSKRPVLIGPSIAIVRRKLPICKRAHEAEDGRRSPQMSAKVSV